MFPVLQGRLIHHKSAFIALALINQFMEAVILRGIMYNLMQFPEMFVEMAHIEVLRLLLRERERFRSLVY